MSQALAAAERVAWLRLARTPSIGPVLFGQLVARRGSAARALADAADRGADLPPSREIEAELAAGEALGARLIAACEPDFPPSLAALDPPPPAIWALGRTELLSRPSIAIVGARIGSAAGQRFARTLAADLGAAGYAVVSGMARGIDAAAHEGSLPTGSIAVLAGGVDDAFPSEHADLYRRLAERGCVVSERAVGHRARAKDFPRRNRLISGLAVGVVVVEAELRSGSLITARLAAEQGREVFAVPGSPLDPRSRGTNDLIRQGAVLCEGVDDVLRALEQPLSLPKPRTVHSLDDEPEGAVDALLERVAGLLSPTPIPCDELVRITGAPAALVNGALTELALAGRAQLRPGGLAVSTGR